MSPIKKVPLGCKSPLLKHVVSFRRHVFMILKDYADYEVFRLWRRRAPYPVLPGEAARPRSAYRGCAARRAPRLKEAGTGKGRRRQGPKAGLEPRGGERDSGGKESDGAGCSGPVEEDAAQSECRTELELNTDRDLELSTDPLADSVTEIVDFVLDDHRTVLDDPARPVFKTPVSKRKKARHGQYQTRSAKKAVGAAGQLDKAAAAETDKR
ncbi:hypothetical protein MHYP_G00000640 [Metynnis hypsauchen]